MATKSINMALTESAHKKLTEISDARVESGGMHHKKHLMTEAIELLHKKEIRNAKATQQA